MEIDLMTVLITGAGLIGTHTAKVLLDQGVGVALFDPEPNLPYIVSVVGKDRKLIRVERGDVRDLPRIMELMLRIGVTRILHTAALTGPLADENPSLAFHINLAGTLNLLEATRIRGLARAVFISSSSAQGPGRLPGSALPTETELRPLPGTLAGAYLAMSEIMIRAFNQLQGVNAIVCRPCAVFGRGRHDGSIPDDAAIEGLVRQGVAYVPGLPLTVRFPTAELAYVKDIALGVREAIFVEKPTTRVYDLGSGQIVTSSDVAAALENALPGLRTASFDEATGSTSLLDSTLAQQELGYNPTWSFQAAMRDYVNELRPTSS
jgi:nucleoside-diphosphate-sugar epimerase